MNQHDLIADKIEEAIGNMFYAVQTEYSKQFAYSLLFNPNKNNTWFVVLFSPTFMNLKSTARRNLLFALQLFVG